VSTSNFANTLCDISAASLIPSNVNSAVNCCRTTQLGGVGVAVESNVNVRKHIVTSRERERGRGVVACATGQLRRYSDGLWAGQPEFDSRKGQDTLL
jgi:hypothetical protein